MVGEILEFLAAVLLALIGGAVGGAIINGINERKIAKLKHQWELEDRKKYDMDTKLAAIDSVLDAQNTGLRFLLYDRIRYLGQAYINDGEVDFDDRRILNDMHGSYHNGLGGNGDLDTLMDAVNSLPLKRRG